MDIGRVCAIAIKCGPLALFEAFFFQTRDEQTIGGVADREGLLIRCPDRDNPKGEREGDVDRLAYQGDRAHP